MAEVKQIDPIQGEIIHEYDGIQEADNALPMWWLWTFFIAIGFGSVYWFYYEVFKIAEGPQAAYFAEKAARAAQTGADPSPEALLAAMSTPAMAKGKEIFVQTCAACHLERGQGKIGPNLTDSAWLHGGDPVAIYRTIRDGVPEKGMPAWGPALGALNVQQVATFVLSLRNTNVPGKPPEGKVE